MTEKERMAELLDLIAESALFGLYENVDFDNLSKAKIGHNTFLYMKDNLNLNDELISELKTWSYDPDPIFLEYINGELVVS